MEHFKVDASLGAVENIIRAEKQVAGSTYSRPVWLADISMGLSLHKNEDAAKKAVESAYPDKDDKVKRSTAMLCIMYAPTMDEAVKVAEKARDEYKSPRRGAELVYSVLRKYKENGYLPNPAEYKPDTTAATRKELQTGFDNRIKRLVADATKEGFELRWADGKLTAVDVKPVVEEEVAPAAPAAPAADAMAAMMQQMVAMQAQIAALLQK